MRNSRLSAFLAVCMWLLTCSAGFGKDTKVPLFEGLGDVSRKITTESPVAQRYFDQGMCFLFAFNHDEAVRSFRAAADADPRCAMGWWGIAVANGPHINNPAMTPEKSKVAWEALVRARESSRTASDVEQALIEALAKRYADPAPEDRKPLDEAYAAAMRELHKRYPEDADIGALCAESLMDLRPWDLWTIDGTAQPGTEEILATLEGVLAKSPKHPLALHLYIHAVEASPHPEKADAAADRLRDLQPGLGHMLHMPSHIDVRRGRWEAAAVANDRAIAADRRYRAQRPQQGFYRLYMIHNHHMLAYAAMMRGESARAIRAIDEMVAGVPEDWVRQNAAFADGILAMPLEVRMRFGRWDEILAAPEPPEYAPLSRALRLAARGVALAARGRVAEACAERDHFSRARERVPATTTFGNNAAADLLAVAEHLLAGEILLRQGRPDEGIAELREAVRLEDALRYAEPPDWLQTVRHALGAALMQAGRPAEAERVYRDDLARLPENGWSLFGLSRALTIQGKRDEAAQMAARFKAVWKDADVTITSSCFCQPGKN